MHTSTLLSLTLCLAPLAHASFSLNTSGPDWDYVAKDLANTTSAACITAYSAPIDCDATLLGLVASMRSGFDPTSTDLDNTCTKTCADSLTAYIAGVKKACTADGDAAQEYTGGSDVHEYQLVPVELVGEIFQYTFKQDCRLDDAGGYCFLSSSISSASDFDCTDPCAVSFYRLAHDYAASAHLFRSYWLVAQSDWWEEYYATGWKHLQFCQSGSDIDDDEAFGSSSASATASGSASASGSKTKTSEASAATVQSGAAASATTTGGMASSTGTAKATGSGSATAAAASATASTASGGAVAGMKAGGSVVGLAGLSLVGMLVL